MKRTKNLIKDIFIRWILFICILLLVFLIILIRTRKIVVTYAKSSVETLLLNSANEATLNVLEKENITYDGISHISRDSEGSFKGIEIDTRQINLLKSKISGEISSITPDTFDISIPIGTLLGGVYTAGLGPDITFHLKQTNTARADFKNEFSDAGINQTLHKIIIDINMSANLLLLGYSDGFSVSTTVIAAQTVIVGAVPESFTNVVEEPYDDVADEIFNYAE